MSKCGQLLTAILVLAFLSLGMLVILYYSVLLPQVRKMDVDIKRTRGTLLLFPSDILAAISNFVGSGSGSW